MANKQDIETLFSWYKQYSIERPLNLDFESPNLFCKLNTDQIYDIFLDGKRIEIPLQYKRFLSEIGYGRLKKDVTGNITSTFKNYFMNIDEINNVISKKSEEWEIYDDFLDENEVPFFDIGNHSMLVFRKNSDGAFEITYPYGQPIFAEDLYDFLYKLHNDVEFFVKGEFS